MKVVKYKKNHYIIKIRTIKRSLMLKKWLEENEIYFKIITSILFGLAAILVSITSLFFGGYFKKFCRGKTGFDGIKKSYRGG